MATWTKVRPLRTLTFDCESRPLSYLGRDFTTAEITVVAWSWGGRTIEATVLHEADEQDRSALLEPFLAAYAEADLVTGHFIRRHDLPRINAMLLELGRAPLSRKLTHDTYLDLKRRDGVSGSQESLAAMLGVKAPKMGMGQVAWRLANRMIPEGVDLARRRAVADVKQHMAMRRELVRRDWLKPPRIWTP